MTESHGQQLKYKESPGRVCEILEHSTANEHKQLVKKIQDIAKKNDEHASKLEKMSSKIDKVITKFDVSVNISYKVLIQGREINQNICMPNSCGTTFTTSFYKNDMGPHSFRNLNDPDTKIERYENVSQKRGRSIENFDDEISDITWESESESESEYDPVKKVKV